MDVFSRYCGQVCQMIRSKAGRADAARELTAHLEDHAGALEDRGVLSLIHICGSGSSQ